MAMVMPRSRSSGALSIDSKARYSASPFRLRYLVMAAVRLVLPWSMWPIVPMFTCGLVRSNFFLAISARFSLSDRCSADPGLGDELLSEVARDLCVVRQLHRIARATLGHRPQVGRVAEHLGERHRGADDRRRAPVLGALEVAAAAVEVADDVAHELLGHRDLDPHHGLEDRRTGLLDGILDGHRGGDLERHLRRVDLVVRAVEDGDLDVDHRVAGIDAGLEGLGDALVDRAHVLARDGPADDLVDELVARALLVGLGVEDDVAVLALAAGLAHEAAVALRGAADRLAVADLWAADVRSDLELPDHAVDDDVEVQLAHAGDERLAALRVGLDPEGGVLLGQALQGDAHLVLVGPRPGLDLDLDHRLRERDRLEQDRVIRVAQSVAREALLEPDDGADVARVDLV